MLCQKVCWCYKSVIGELDSESHFAVDFFKNRIKTRCFWEKIKKIGITLQHCFLELRSRYINAVLYILLAQKIEHHRFLPALQYRRPHCKIVNHRLLCPLFAFMPQFYHRLFLRCLLLFYDYYYIAQIVRKQALISPKICKIRTDFSKMCGKIFCAKNGTNAEDMQKEKRLYWLFLRFSV